MSGILVTGATGVMGRELMKILPFTTFAVNSKVCDLRDQAQVDELLKRYDPDLVVHLAAYTDVKNAEIDKQNCYDVNVIGTRNLAKRAKALLYVSTEYVFDGEKGNYTELDYPNPVNFYSLTKLLGEYEAMDNYHPVIVRLLFKPRPYEHAIVPRDMYTSGDYVDVMAKELAIAIENFDKLPRILNIGTGRKSLLDFARQTRTVTETSREAIGTTLPGDTSLDCSVWEQLKESLKISIDIDGTYVKYPEFFHAFIKAMKDAGHTVGALTGRTPETVPEDDWDFKVGGHEIDEWPHETDEQRCIGKSELMKKYAIDYHFDDMADHFNQDVKVFKV